MIVTFQFLKANKYEQRFAFLDFMLKSETAIKSLLLLRLQHLTLFVKQHDENFLRSKSVKPNVPIICESVLGLAYHEEGTFNIFRCIDLQQLKMTFKLRFEVIFRLKLREVSLIVTYLTLLHFLFDRQPKFSRIIRKTQLTVIAFLMLASEVNRLFGFVYFADCVDRTADAQ